MRGKDVALIAVLAKKKEDGKYRRKYREGVQCLKLQTRFAGDSSKCSFYAWK